MNTQPLPALPLTNTRRSTFSLPQNIVTPPLGCILVGSGAETLVIQFSPSLIVVIEGRVMTELGTGVLVGATPKVDQPWATVA